MDVEEQQDTSISSSLYLSGPGIQGLVPVVSIHRASFVEESVTALPEVLCHM